MEIKELSAQMAEAIAKNDVEAMEKIAGEITKGKKDRHAEESKAQQAQAEKLAGVREATATEVHQMVRAIPGLDEKLRKVESWGFTYKVDKANPDEPDITYKSVSLTIAKVRKAGGGGNGGGAGKTKDEYGMSLAEVYDKFKTPEDEASLVKAVKDDEAATAKLGKTTNSNQWRVKNEVKKRAIKDELLKPAK